VDGPRGQRDGVEVTARRAARARRRLVGAVTASVVAIAVLFLAGLPVKTYLQQRNDTRKAEAALAEVQEERQRIARETSRLETPAAIEERAREELGFQRPDEETYNVLPVPSEPLGLPDAWPFTGVERALGSQ